MAKMLYALEISLQNSPWLNQKGADRAAIELARHYCQLMDEAVEMADPDLMQRTFAVCGPNLQKTLSSLGLTPLDRGELSKLGENKPKESKLDELKQRRQKKTAAG